jgi:hypothetical protein
MVLLGGGGTFLAYQRIPDVPAFEKPADLKATDITSESVTFTWRQPGAPVASYDIYQSTDNNSDVQPSASAERVLGTMYTLVHLKPAHQYRFVVIAHSITNETLSSDSLPVTTLQQAPVPQPGKKDYGPLSPVAPPSGLTAQQTGQGVTLTWNSANTPGVGYRVLRDGVPVGPPIPYSQTTYTDNGLPPGTDCTYTVRLVLRSNEETADSNGYEIQAPPSVSPSPSATAEPGSTTAGQPGYRQAPPSAPLNVEITATTQTSLSVAWHQPAYAGSAGLRAYHVFLNGVLTATTVSTTYTITGLKASTRYGIQINASSMDGLISPLSTAAIAMTAAAPVTYPYTLTMNRSLTCQTGCWASDQMTTFLSTATVTARGQVDLHVVYTNHTANSIDIVFDGPDLLTDNHGNIDQAFSNVGGTGSITVPAGSSTPYTIQFGGLDPTPGTSCVFSSDIEQGNVFTIVYADITVPCS